MRKLIQSHKGTQNENKELARRNESLSKTLRQREKEVDDLHIELSNCERKFQDSLNKMRIQYEDKLMKMSSELDQSNSTSLEMCKQRMMQQKNDYERQIQDLKRQLMSFHQGSGSSNSGRNNQQNNDHQPLMSRSSATGRASSGSTGGIGSLTLSHPASSSSTSGRSGVASSSASSASTGGSGLSSSAPTKRSLQTARNPNPLELSRSRSKTRK